MTREEAEAEVNKLGLTGQERAKKINELMGKKASDFEGGTAKEGKSEKQIKAEKKAEKAKKIYRKKDAAPAKQDDGIKRTGKVIHIVSKRQPTQED